MQPRIEEAEEITIVDGVLRAAARALGMEVSSLDPETPLTALGLDSLAAIEIQQGLREELDVEISLERLLTGASVAELAREIAAGGERPAKPTAPAALVASTLDGDPPLTYGQQALWFLNRLAPQSGAYHIVAAARLLSPLDVPALDRAFAALVARHPALRTTFHAHEGEPRQRVHPPQGSPEGFTVIDASGLNEAAVEALVASEAYRPFDLEAGPLLRLTLLDGAPGGDRVVISLHHLVADFASMALLARDLGRLYAGAPLPPLSPSSVDLSAWEAARLAGGEGERLWSYWRAALAGAPLALDLPTDRPRPPEQSFAGAAVRLTLGPSAAVLVRARGATLFMGLLAVYQTLLQRYTGQEDLLVGVPAAGRDRAELRDRIGYLVNPLVLRGRPAGDLPFTTLLAETRRAVLDAFAHQGFPFPLLAERLRPERDPARSPVFQASLVLERAEPSEPQALAAFAVGEPGVPIDLGGLALESLSIPERSAQFDLALRAADLGTRGLVLSLQYSSDLFDAVTVHRLLGHFARLVEAVVEDPESRLGDLPIFGEAERFQLAAEWSDTRVDYALDAPLHARIAEQARRTPGAIAVVAGEREVSYRELDRRSNRLARRLATLGVGPESRVGLSVERSVELMVGLLGILKAGAAYVPLDPEYPAERLAFMAEEAVGTGGVVLVGPDQPAAPWVGMRELRLDESGPEPADGEESPEVRAPVDALAYVIYTSGSTGRPKGVMNNHRGVLNRLLWMQELYPLGVDDRVLQKTPVGFDVSVWELLWPLLFGAQVVLARPGGHRDPAYLVRWMAEQWVTVAHFVPSLLQSFLEEDLSALSTLRRVFVSGEALSYELEQRTLSRLPVPLCNLYGPTEAAVDVTAWRCRASVVARPVPIGRSVANTHVYVVDRRGVPVPIGVAGELWIGGVQVARGYQGRPDGTAERFVPDPWAVSPGARAYRTGDRVRRSPTGEIEFLGRLDFQVKVRGVRVELGEIESALAAQPEVQAAAVLALGEGAGVRLVAFVVPASGSAVETAALRDRLRERLPDAMVPSGVVALPALPLSTSGKLDRRALALLAPAAAPAADEAPRTQVEAVLAELWRELLGTEERIGRGSHFFALGGHSLLATRLSARLARRLGVELPLTAVFTAPVLSALAARIEALVPVRQRSTPPIRRASRRRPLPLSFTQERLWLLDRLAPGGAAYNMPAAVRLEGPLDRATLGAVFAELVRRHEVLRTRFLTVEGNPVQEIASPAPVPLPLVDLAGLDGAGRPELARLEREEARRPFDLARGPLLRATLLRSAEEEHNLLVILHHTVADGWSVGVLEREVATLYGAFAQGRPSPLPELPVQYADYAVWQRARFRGKRLDRELAWWRERLAGAPAELALPFDRPRPALPGGRGAALPFQLPGDLSTALARRARQAEATPFMVLLSGLQALLARYSGERTVPVGTPVANRPRFELEGLIGPFVNTLALVGDLDGDPSFGELLDRTRSATLAAFAHQELPFEKLVEALSPERQLGRMPLFQVLLVLQNTPRADLALEGLRLAWREIETGSAKLDLSVTLAESPAGLTGTIEYDAERFNRTTIVRLAAHLTRWLEAVVEDPERRLSNLPLLTPAERFQLAAEWSDTRVGYTLDVPLHERIAEQARRTPGAVAVVAAEREVSYRELDLRSDRLAHRLAALGVGPESRVGLAALRSVELMVGLLGILKAGAAYVPLDPEYPAERLAFMAGEAVGAGGVVLVGPGVSSSIFEGTGVEQLALDESGPEPPAGEKPAVRVPTDALAYVIYTSGSTGRPKGVMNRHRGILNRLLWMQALSPLSAEDRVLQKTSVGFDVSVWELFWPLLYGARVVLARPGGHCDPAYLVRWMSEQRVTVAHFVPSLLQGFLEEEGLSRLSSLRRLFLSGEALSHELEQRALSRLSATIYNLYGPTEAAVDVTFWRCRVSAVARPVPIGRPVANTHVYVVDGRGQPLPIGVAGELWIGGVQVARGYQGRPDGTAERFVPDVWDASPGARAYRTGDLVRQMPSGEIEYLGRLDFQVKVRGVRVELGEIESALAAQPEVQAAAMLALGKGATARLVAFVVPAPGSEVDPGPLRERLRERLPDAMVPSEIVALSVLPLTENGKLDRRALARLAPTTSPLEAGELPRTPVEKRLATLWRELLGTEIRTGRGSDFFALGGHSLLASRLSARVERRLGVELPLATIFAAPTLSALALRIEALVPEKRRATRPIRRVSRARPLPLSFGQERLWFLDRLARGGAPYNMPAAVLLRGPLDRAVLAAVFAEMTRRHEVLRTRFPASFPDMEGSPVQEIAPAAVVALPLVDLAGLTGLTGPDAERTRLEREEARRPFYLARGPLLRTTLVRGAGSAGENEHTLLVTLHHIAADGWSVGVLEREVAALYGAFAAGRPSPLPDLPVQYADYAAWQRARFRGERLEREVAWWRERLAGVPAELALPFDRPRPALPEQRGATLPFALPADLSAALARRSRQAEATPFMVLLSALQALLARYSGERRVPVGTPVANRPRVELEGLIGFFVNTLALVGDLDGDPSFGDLLARTRGMALAAFAHQELPFEKLVEALSPERHLGRMPLFQVLLAFQNTLPAEGALAGLRLAWRAVETGSAKLDLSLLLAESPAGIAGTIEYDAERFDRTTIVRLAAHLTRLLEAAMEDPARRLSALPLLAPAERFQLAAEWSDTRVAYAPESPLHEWIVAQARRTPGAVAVVAGEREVSYRELDRRSGRLARRLVALGVGLESRVGLAALRSVELMVGLLGILKAGAAYVPLDPEYPAERLVFMAEDAVGADGVVLVGPGVSPVIFEETGMRQLALDESGPEPVDGAEPPDVWVPVDALAYVIYTSGSTGRPK
ncbi:MAG TPA: amino acid adenylation domain-containing protein, partial [Thermoanaerobaculia bacterium]|nr:amino acid adenylation domain-containing protein [Thermoanaerobaculia bacterium]